MSLRFVIRSSIAAQEKQSVRTRDIAPACGPALAILILLLAALRPFRISVIAGHALPMAEDVPNLGPWCQSGVSMVAFHTC